MRALAKLTWVELKLFAREPITLVFTIAFPLIILVVMGGVFGNNPDPDIFRGLGAMNYYVPAYLGLVMAAVGLISLPVHLAGYRERGVLRRLRASSVPVWSFFGSQLLVSFAVAAVGGALLVAVCLPIYDVHLPMAAGQLAVGFALGAVSFSALGVLLGALLPTARAAQGAGLPLFFVMFVLSGSAPPREVMTTAMQRTGQAMPLWHVVTVLQDGWNGLGWNALALAVVAGVAVAAALASMRLFRWE